MRIITKMLIGMVLGREWENVTDIPIPTIVICHRQLLARAGIGSVAVTDDQLTHTKNDQ